MPRSPSRKRNGLTSVITWRTSSGSLVGQLAGVHPAEAPPDDADLLAGALVQLDEALLEPAHDVGMGTVVASQPPTVGIVAAQAEHRPQRPGREIRAGEAGEHEHGMAVATRDVPEEP